MKYYLSIIGCLFLLVAGCGQKAGEVPPKENFKETIRIYNGLLADGYRRQNMNHLIHAATEKKATKAYYHMAALGEGGVKMDSNLRELEVIGNKHLADNKAEVTCKERWEYRYINIYNGTSSPLLTANYTTRYRLVKEKEKWLVSSVTILYSDRAKDADVLSFLQRPPKVPQGSVPDHGQLEPIATPQKTTGKSRPDKQ